MKELNNTKNIIWQGSPSQLMYLHIHLFNFIMIIGIAYFTDYIIERFYFIKLGYLFIIMFLLLSWSIYLIIKNYTIEYIIYDDIISFKRGILNLKYDETELYRIKDYSLKAPLFYRIFSLSNIYMVSSDKLCPVIELKAIGDGLNLLRKIEIRVEEERERKKVREID